MPGNSGGLTEPEAGLRGSPLSSAKDRRRASFEKMKFSRLGCIKARRLPMPGPRHAEIHRDRPGDCLKKTPDSGVAARCHAEGLRRTSETGRQVKGSDGRDLRQAKRATGTSGSPGELMRVCRRLQLLRASSHDNQDDNQIFTGSSRPCSADGFGSRRRTALRPSSWRQACQAGPSAPRFPRALSGPWPAPRRILRG